MAFDYLFLVYQAIDLYSVVDFKNPEIAAE